MRLTSDTCNHAPVRILRDSTRLHQGRYFCSKISSTFLGSFFWEINLHSFSEISFRIFFFGNFQYLLRKKLSSCSEIRILFFGNFFLENNHIVYRTFFRKFLNTLFRNNQLHMSLNACFWESHTIAFLFTVSQKANAVGSK